MARAELPTRATCIPFRAVFLPNCGFTFLILPSNSVGSILGARSCCFSARKQQPKVRPTFSKSWKKTKIRQTAVFRASSLSFSCRDSTHPVCVSWAIHPLRSSRILESSFTFVPVFFFLLVFLNGKTRYVFLLFFLSPYWWLENQLLKYIFLVILVGLILLSCVIAAFKAFHLSAPILMHWHFFFNQHIFVILLFIYFWLDNRSWARRVAPSCANLPNDVLIVLLFCHAPGILSVPWRDVIPTWKSTGQKILCVYFWVRFFSFNFLYFSLRAVILSLSFIRGASYFIHTHHHFFV